MVDKISSDSDLILMGRCDVQSFVLSISQQLSLPSFPLTSPPPFNQVAQQPTKKLVHVASHNSFFVSLVNLAIGRVH